MCKSICRFLSCGLETHAVRPRIIGKLFNLTLLPCVLTRHISNFVFIISYEPSIPYSVLSLVVLLCLLSYVSMTYLPFLTFIILFPLLNSYLLTSSFVEYLYSSLLLFIFLEVMLFLAYFWFYFHNFSLTGNFSKVNPLMVSSGTYYMIAGLLLSLLSMYLSITPIVLFILLSSTEFNNVLDITYINDNPFVSIQLTIVTLHLLHLLVGILFILSEISYPHYYHFIEVIWLLIGYCIYLE